VVLDRHRDPLAVAARPHDHLRALARELRGVSDQIDEHLLQEIGIRLDRGKIGRQVRPEARLLVLQLRRDRPRDLVQETRDRDRLRLETAAPGLHAAQVEDVVHDPREPVAFLVHDHEELLLHRERRASQIVDQGLGIRLDRRERGAKLVRDDRDQVRLGLVHPAESQHRVLELLPRGVQLGPGADPVHREPDLIGEEEEGAAAALGQGDPLPVPDHRDAEERRSDEDRNSDDRLGGPGLPCDRRPLGARVLEDQGLAPEDAPQEALRLDDDARVAGRVRAAALVMISLQLTGFVAQEKERELVGAGQLEHVVGDRGDEPCRVERGTDAEAQTPETGQEPGRTPRAPASGRRRGHGVEPSGPGVPRRGNTGVPSERRS
jgi:hypothetical protein